MRHSQSRRGYRHQKDVEQYTPPPIIKIKPPSKKVSLRSLRNVPKVPDRAHRVHLEDAGRIGLTLEEVETLIPDEYGPLTPWTARKLCLDYGVRDLQNPSLPGRSHLKIVAPIAEELVHDTIVLLWEKAKESKVELNNASHMRGWLKNAIKFAILQWVQKGARAYERQVYSVSMVGDEEDSSYPEVIEPWDASNRGILWQKIQELVNKSDSEYPPTPTEQEKVVSAELKMALTNLPRDIYKVILQVYRDQETWGEVAAVLNIRGKDLEREIMRCLFSLKRQIPSYQPGPRLMLKDTRRVRKSLHCPVCDTPLRRQKWNNGGGCMSCEMRIHKNQFVIKYSYHV